MQCWSSEHDAIRRTAIILALVWALIVFFQLNAIALDGISGKKGLLLWCQRRTKNYDNVDVTEPKLTIRAKRRKRKDLELKSESLDEELEREFDQREHKTDKTIWNPLALKEDLYTERKGKTLDAQVNRKMREEATGRAAHYTMLTDDCSVPWGAGCVPWTPGHGFTISSDQFARVCTGKIDGKNTFAAARAKKLERYWTLIAFADPASVPAKLHVRGRRHGDEPSKLTEAVRVAVEAHGDDPAKLTEAVNAAVAMHGDEPAKLVEAVHAAVEAHGDEPAKLTEAVHAAIEKLGDDPAKLIRAVRAAAETRVGAIPAGIENFRFEPERFANFRRSMANVVTELPTRMAETVRVAVIEASHDASRLYFLDDVDAVMETQAIRRESWLEYDFTSLPLDTLGLLARWAQSFLDDAPSALRTALGRRPGDDPQTAAAIAAAVRPVPTEFSWSALADGAELSPERVRDLMRWTRDTDACAKSDPWRCSGAPPVARPLGRVDLSARRFASGA